MKIVAVPKTIDNDLSATDVTFGFDTAVTTATDAVDKIHTTAESHHRVMVVEVMGRDAGWIALHSGIPGGAHVIRISEIPFTVQNICDYMKRREGYGKRFTIVVVAEGIKLPPEMKHMSRGGSRWQHGGRRDRPAFAQGSASQRTGSHPARRLAHALRSCARDPLRRRRRRPDRRRARDRHLLRGLVSSGLLTTESRRRGENCD